jgi:hypothetical protein
MTAEQREFLNLGTPPARLNAQEVSWLLGFQEHDVPILVAEGLLKPLGRPARNSPKYFARTEIEICVRDPKWLGRASAVIHNYWRQHHEHTSSNGRRFNGEHTAARHGSRSRSNFKSPDET